MKRLILALCICSSIPLTAAAQASTPVFGNPRVSHWPPSRSYHVENYKLSLRFDEPKGEVFGDEVITLRPFEPHFQKFYLGSAELTIDDVTLENANGAPLKLAFAHQADQLWITLDREYDARTLLQVRIRYHGFPRTGLFFVNPTPTYPKWPREVYSQGEPEFNHYWFPCWDYPNDMATSETVTTVPDGQVVVSNGKLAKVTRSRGSVTYDWVEGVPHSSYLISIAVGPWHRFADKYEDKPVDYYVPDTVDETTAQRSFHLTPDMIGFFSRATGVDYPYEQYAQTTVQNYIFGGQENVSATTLTDGTLHDARADRDYPSTNLVSHELGQQWFGDYVQGRDWANIWLNEGFATYLEALYTQHHAGNDAYRFAIFQDQLTSQQEDRSRYRRPIVDRHYADPLDMFDATTHEKGAAVLEMLRYVVDGVNAASRPASQTEPLFKAFHYYLASHHAQSADTSDLIDSIRKTTGMELGWFFHEWVFMSGWPEYRVEASYDPARRAEKVIVTQEQQTTSDRPIFDMPIELAFYSANGSVKKGQVRDNLQRQEFEIPLAFEPAWVDFDPDDFIDKTLEFPKPVAALIAEAEKDPSTMSRLWAAQQLGSTTLGNSDERVSAMSHVLANDPFYGVRAAAAQSLGSIATEKAKAALLGALNQSDSRVRTVIVEALSNFSNERAIYDVLLKALHQDSSYAVQAAAATGLGKSGAARAFDDLRAEEMASPELHVMQATLGALAATKDARAVEILLARAKPGAPERIRISALTDLTKMKEAIAQNQLPDLIEVTRGALNDPFYLTRAAAEKLVGAFHLTQFEADIQAQAQSAPMAMQRAAAQRVLDQLHHQK